MVVPVVVVAIFVVVVVAAGVVVVVSAAEIKVCVCVCVCVCACVRVCHMPSQGGGKELLSIDRCRVRFTVRFSLRVMVSVIK